MNYDDFSDVIRKFGRGVLGTLAKGDEFQAENKPAMHPESREKHSAHCCEAFRTAEEISG